MIITHVLVDDTGAVLHTFHGPADFRVGDTQYGEDVFEGRAAAERAAIGLLAVELVEVSHDPATQDHGEWGLVYEGERWLCRNTPVALSADILADRLATAKAIKTAELRAACAAAITAGYVSEALGAAHDYPNKATDQSNMAASVLASLMPGLAADWVTPFWAGAGGIWAMRPHTAEQIRRAGADGKAHVLACQARLSGEDGQGGLLKAVAKAQSVAEVAVVVW